MTPQDLKNSILQLAIQGKLVPQRPEEGSAADLLKEIQRRSDFPVASSKSAKKKSPKATRKSLLPCVPASEIPFEIPETWKWVRLKEITLLNPKNQLDDTLDVSFIPMTLVGDGYNNHHGFEVRKWNDIKKGFTHFANGDIGVAKITPCFQNRKSVVFSKLKNGFGAGTTELSVIRPFSQIVCTQYLLWFFKSAHFISKGIKSFTGTAGQQRIHKNYISMCPFPLPPLAEQKRIVEKIEELLPLCERYGNAYNELQALNQRVPADLKKSLLQLAIQGKLVPQRPEEGSAADLLKEIQRRSDFPVASSKSAKKKSPKATRKSLLPCVPASEIPFEIPKTWKWVRLGEIFSLQAGKNITASQIHKEKSSINRYLCYGGNGIRGYVSKFNRTGHFALIGRQGALCGNINIANGDFYATEHAVVVDHYNVTDVQWGAYFLKALNLNQYATATAQPGLAVSNIVNILIPLPPLAEQKRIVAKLEELLPLCDRLSCAQSGALASKIP